MSEKNLTKSGAKEIAKELGISKSEAYREWQRLKLAKDNFSLGVDLSHPRIQDGLSLVQDRKPGL